MSAFLCTTRHIATIAQWAANEHLVEDAAKCARALRSLNNAAMRVRYGAQPVRLQTKTLAIELEDARHGIERAYPGDAAASYVLALLDCLEYQCSEGDVLTTHKHAMLLESLVGAAQLGAKGVPLPGVWSI